GLDEGAVRSLIVDGIIGGLGTVLLFVPQIALLMAMVGILEASGYMARAVFLLDRLLRKVGLTGKSFVPLSSSFACAIPGIMASRIITDERDRLTTILVAPLMSCSARLPVYVVMLAAFFPAHQAGLLLFLLYMLGIVAAFVVAFVLRKTLLRGGVSILAMELPVYHMPPLRHVGRHAWMSVREFLRTAGTVILAATVVVWALGYFPRPAEIHDRFEALRMAAPEGAVGDAERARLDGAEAAAYLEQSVLASIGRAVQPAFALAGFDWKLTVGILAAFPARELVVPTLGTLHSLGDVAADSDADAESVVRLRTALQRARNEDGSRSMTGLVALAAMAFFALCSQCASTLATIRRETHSWFWPGFTFAYMTGLAWLVAVTIYQVGSLFGYQDS
ncbi:MAG: ferrous iron transporter B, partial [Planctomycetes bacterium]|nr:ferrous iron transporter B [Planctomycetota bacterium]